MWHSNSVLIKKSEAQDFEVNKVLWSSAHGTDQLLLTDFMFILWNSSYEMEAWSSSPLDQSCTPPESQSQCHTVLTVSISYPYIKNRTILLRLPVIDLNCWTDLCLPCNTPLISTLLSPSWCLLLLEPLICASLDRILVAIEINWLLLCI